MFIIVMVMSRDIVIYITCMFYFFWEVITTIKSKQFIYFSYIDIIISVYSIMFINYYITDTLSCLFFGFETLMNL